MRHHSVSLLSKEVGECAGGPEAFLSNLHAEIAAEEEEFLGHVLAALETLRNALAQKVTGMMRTRTLRGYVRGNSLDTDWPR